MAQQQVDVKVLTFDDDFMALAYVSQTQMEWPLLLDEERGLYRAYGMQRANWWKLYSPLAIFRYLKLIWKGRRPGKPGKDWKQLGGDVVIDPQGVIRLIHLSQDPHDRPPVEDLLRLVMPSG